MSEIDLQQFCSDDIFRDYLHKPFSKGEYSYASNGHILVRVPRRPELQESAKDYAWDKPLDGIGGMTFSPLRHDDLPSIPGPKKVECEECNGTGKEHECPDCDCECQNCDGTGEDTKETKISTVIRGNIYNLRYIVQVLSLPGATLADRTADGDPLLFKFDGGVGAVMPLRCQYSEHILVEKETQAA